MTHLFYDYYTDNNNENAHFISPFISLFKPLSPQMDNTNIHNPYESYSSYSNFYKRTHSTEWTDIVLQPYPFTTHYTQGMSFIIRELLPDQQYEAKVIARLLSFLINICFVIVFFSLAYLRSIEE